MELDFIARLAADLAQQCVQQSRDVEIVAPLWDPIQHSLTMDLAGVQNDLRWIGPMKVPSSEPRMLDEFPGLPEHDQIAAESCEAA